jgi:hypothetical protein
MYLDAEISDHLDIALLLKTKTKKQKQQTKNYYMLGLCVSLGRVLTRQVVWFCWLPGWVTIASYMSEARDSLVCVRYGHAVVITSISPTLEINL